MTTTDTVGWHTAEGVSEHYENPHFMGCLNCTPDHQRVPENEVTAEDAAEWGYRCDECGRTLLEVANA